ncbi:hypothetical protein Tco_0316649 [Tanacetum coccineum]
MYRPPVHQPVVNQPVAHQGPAPQTHASTSGSGTLPGNTVTNPKEDLKGILTTKWCSNPRPESNNHDTKVTKTRMPPEYTESTEDSNLLFCSNSVSRKSKS